MSGCFNSSNDRSIPSNLLTVGLSTPSGCLCIANVPPVQIIKIDPRLSPAFDDAELPGAIDTTGGAAVTGTTTGADFMSDTTTVVGMVVTIVPGGYDGLANSGGGALASAPDVIETPDAGGLPLTVLEVIEPEVIEPDAPPVPVVVAVAVALVLRLEVGAGSDFVLASLTAAAVFMTGAVTAAPDTEFIASCGDRL